MTSSGKVYIASMNLRGKWGFKLHDSKIQKSIIYNYMYFLILLKNKIDFYLKYVVII